MLIVGAVLGVLLLGCGGVTALGYWLVARPSGVAGPETARVEPTWPPPAGRTKESLKTSPNWERVWTNLLQAQGFSVRLPIGATGGPRTVVIDGAPVTGHRYTVEEGGIGYRVEWYDWPAGRTAGPDEFERKLREVDRRQAVSMRSYLIHWDGSSAFEMVFESPAGETETARVRKVNERVYLFGVKHHPARVGEFPGLDPAAKRKAFFDSVRVIAGASPPAVTKTPNVKESPAVEPPTTSLARAATVSPHTTSLVLPKAREVLTFAPKGRLGLLHRYELPSFRQVKTVVLAKPVSLAIADEAAGRLYVATFTPASDADPRERLDAVGDVAAFDLAPLRNEVPQPGPLEPVATHSLGAKVTALDLTQDGRFLYAVVIEPAGGAPAKFRSKLVKLATPTLTKLAEQEMPAPILGARLFPDGKTMLAFEHPFTAAGQPVFGTAVSGTVRGVDVDTLKELFRIVVPAGLVSDVQFVGPGRAVAVVVTANRPRLVEVTTAGTVTDVTPAGGLKSLQAGYLGEASGRLVTSTRIPGTTGAEVLAVIPGSKPEPRAFEPLLAGATMSGRVTLTPDGRFAVFASGAVAEITDGK